MQHRRKSFSYHFEGFLFAVECYLASRRQPASEQSTPEAESLPEWEAKLRRMDERFARARRAKVS
jgi:hypothetical protein